LEAESAARLLLAGQPLAVQVDGETLQIEPDEVEVRAEARSGLVVSTDGPYLAALHTTLTPELIQEGWAREFVRRVTCANRLVSRSQTVSASYSMLRRTWCGIQAHQDYIMGETSPAFESGPPPEDAAAANRIR
jgi:isoleucyl-tRNA synthetase